jgi:ABC-2 type transport system ATP-binding protein
MMGAPAAIEVSHQTKVFGTRTAVRDVSFAVARGEVFGFLGPNGAGKTTTVRILGTLIAPTSGSASVAGIPVGPATEAEIRQHISITTKAPGLYNRLTVAENLEFFARLYGLSGRDARIFDALSAVGLTARADDLCGSLSKGLKQRASLARYLLNEPAVMFLDEPTSGLDPAAAHEVLGLVNGLRERGVTVFLTTHRLDEAERLCDRVAIMNTSLRTIGTPDELRRTLFTTSLAVATVAPLDHPDKVFGGLPAVQGWQPADPADAAQDAAGPRGGRPGPARYLLTVTDPAAAAPGVTRALVAAPGRRAVDQRDAPLARGRLPGADRRRGGPVMIDANRTGAVIRKELAEFRRNRLIVVTASILPVVFLISPTAGILAIHASASSALLSKRVGYSLFLPLLVPLFVPATMSAYSVVGEREQGTLEPVLTTPITRVELLLGKAVAIFLPAVVVAYLTFGVFLAIVALFADAPVASALWHAPQLPAEVVFIPLLAGWAIWVGLAISSQVSETRVAQQLSLLGSLPPLALIALMSFQVITPSFGLAAGLAGLLLVIDCGA